MNTAVAECVAPQSPELSYKQKHPTEDQHRTEREVGVQKGEWLEFITSFCI